MTGLALTILLPLGTAVAVVLARRYSRVVAVTGTLITWIAALLVAVPVLGGDPAVSGSWGDPAVEIGASFSLEAGPIGMSVLLLASTVGLLVQLYSTAYLADDPRYPSYAGIVALFLAAMHAVTVADNLWLLLVGWEVMGACSYLLIGHHWEEQKARDGAAKAFLLTRVGDLGLLVGIFVLGRWAGSYQISDVLAAVDDRAAHQPSLTTAGLLMLAAVVGKSAQFPLHTWLPDAMPGPTPISALIHAATMVAAGVFLVARLHPVFASSELTMSLLTLVAALTMLMAAGFALVADDLKRVLAWSTVSQLAYMFAALAVGSTVAGVGHLLSHGAFKALLFLAAGVVAHRIGSTLLADMGGLRRALPLTFVTMTVGFAALVGVPPTAGFFSKDAVVAAAHEATSGDAPVPAVIAWAVLLVALLTAAVTGAYAVRCWLLVFFGRPVATTAHHTRWAMSAPLVALAAASLVLGGVVLWPGWLEPDAEGGFHLGIAIVTSAAAAVGCVAAVVAWHRSRDFRPAVLVQELWVDRTLDTSLVRPVLRAARLTIAADRDVVDAYPRGAAATAWGLSALSRRAQTGNAQTYVTVVVLGVLAVALGIGWAVG